MRAPKFIVLALTTISFSLLPATAGAVDWKSLDVPHRPQQTNYYCGVTVIEMWAEWRDGLSLSQATIASDLGVTASDGVQQSELKEAMEDYTSGYFTLVSTSSKYTFSEELVQQVKQGQPMAVMANTRRKNGTTSICAHWLLVDSYVLYTNSYSTAWADLNGFYMNDPIYNSQWTGDYYYISPSTFVTKDFFFGTAISQCDNWWGTVYRGVKD